MVEGTEALEGVGVLWAPFTRAALLVGADLDGGRIRLSLDVGVKGKA